jgi:deazaflavin-dependent oxidoreductase (nitroreductase family)
MQEEREPMLGQIIAVVGVVVVTALAIATVVFLGVRAREPLAIDALRRFSRLFNPMQMRTAGSPGAYASVIRHRGRKSGRVYSTPVGAVATETGFVIALPYGSRANWLRNVMASGSAAIVNDGREYRVDRPELIPLEEVATSFSPSDQRSHRMFRVEHCLRVRRVESTAA